MPRFCANLGFLFAEVDFEQRFARAARAGFRGVEYMSPYAYPVDTLQARLAESGLTQVLFNLPAGDWGAGERGIACLPGREAEFRAGVALGIDYARALGCRQLNCLAGLAPPDVPDAQLRETFKANLRYAAKVLAEHDIRLLVEPINSRIDMPGFWLDTPRKALALIAELHAGGEPNLWLQYDIYHAQIMEGDLARTIAANLPRIAHFQLADHPGRHEPGSGEINYPFLFDLLDRAGYAGWIGCEYRPLNGSEAGLSWAAAYL
ncbi:MAG: hydroxypyruvate isomerase [Rhodocyclaceae bacterium]